ncbi:Transducin beta-like protein 3 [Acropora cervicornis]|uniref:Transducin beta-like protein 3 n=1 Tax=Acropora cervicornis TaxID=6130 RepID=A0AAD9QEZ3_ACRCE|nr:Transducin beta-like protein 3 [Acropora cervicornis]
MARPNRSGVLLKSNFEVSSKIDAFYTGGKVQFSSSEDHFLCTCYDKVQVVHLQTGKTVQTLEEEGDAVSCFALSPDDEFCVTASKSLLLRQWNWISGELIKTWKAVHMAPIASMVFDSTSTLLATGSSDSTIKVWDVIKQYYTHNFKGSSGVVSLVCFHPDPKVLQLFSASMDCKIRIWNLKKSGCVAVLESHFSAITSLAFSSSGDSMIRELNQWLCYLWGSVALDVKMKKKNTLSPLEAKTVLQAKSTKSKSEEDTGQLIVYSTLCKTLGMIAVVTFDHNIILHELTSLKRFKQFVGYNDEILDVCFAGGDQTHLAVATNSSEWKVYNLDTMNCQLLEGHTDIVLSLEVNDRGDMLVTGSKDNSMRVWKMTPQHEFNCVGIGLGHTQAVSTDINSITVSPNDKLLATGSQDKTAKIWLVSDGSTIGTLRGHKKGIWCVRFSPVDQCVATSSADSTIKIWALSDLSCVKTFEGHTSSVLKFSFLSRGMQLISRSEGLIKLWTIKTNECIKTFDQHLNKIWSLAVNKSQDQIVSAGADSVINIWKDVTQIEQEKEQATKEENILRQQELSNLINDHKYLEAIDILLVPNGIEELSQAVKSLREDQQDTILKFLVEWNTNSKNCHVAQAVLSIILKSKSPFELMNKPNMKDAIEALIPYSAFSQVSDAAATGNAHTQEGATSLDDSLKEPGASVAADLPPSPCPDDMDKNRNMEENTDEDIADENDPNGTNNQDCEVKMQDEEEEGKDQAIKDSIKKKLKRKKSLKGDTVEKKKTKIKTKQTAKTKLRAGSGKEKLKIKKKTRVA